MYLSMKKDSTTDERSMEKIHQPPPPQNSKSENECIIVEVMIDPRSLLLALCLVASFITDSLAFIPTQVSPGTHNGNGNGNHQFHTCRSKSNALFDGAIEEFGDRSPEYIKRSDCWIVVVDDEEAIRKAVGQFLYDKGYRVTACADGQTALDVALSRTDDENAAKSVPDCIVSDVRMPNIDGIQLLRAIRSHETLQEVPVVLVTAKGMTQDRIDGYNAGADAYITKPFDPDELIAVVDNVIDRHETLNGDNIEVDDLKKDLDDIKYLLLEEGGGGVGNGWVKSTNVFLAPDEKEVLELLCQGLMTKEIAGNTGLSKRRVEQLLTRMYRKTEVKNRTELVRWAVSTGNVNL
ncbi:unnamed protein product [Cylindrotheca closterium]|uniref:Transcriptional regulator ycf27 n=1 Tax=Cylindrotheca closterium TaxID=2856 RepID=A0AAD2GC08_9STRA|nr:unnamed protein product [Cylindrotheca closterium]